ncbi:tetratricopeptide repeat protein, partial [bacterium AH-315-M05]|nr:tetratricopeptide repeat protein [bacterium AH-315-M05]
MKNNCLPRSEAYRGHSDPARKLCVRRINNNRLITIVILNEAQRSEEPPASKYKLAGGSSGFALRMTIVLLCIGVFLFIPLLGGVRGGFSFLSAEASAKANAQQNKIDSLKQVLKTAKEDTTRIKVLIQLSKQYWYTKPDTAYVIAKNAYTIAEKGDHRKQMAGATNSIAVSLYFRGDYLNALKHWLNSLKIYEELNDKKWISASLGNIGIVYHSQDDYPKALEYYFKALKMDEELRNKRGIALHLGNIGSVYNSQADYTKALEYYFKALKMDEELGNKRGIAIQLGNIGSVYNSQADYPKALEYSFKALKMDKELRRKNGISRNLDRIAIVYAEQNEYEKAHEYYYQSLKIAKEIGDKQHIAILFSNIGTLCTKTGKFKEAEQYLDSALVIDLEIGTIAGQMHSHKALSDLYDTTARYRFAYEHYKKYSTAKDSIFNEEKSKEIGKLEASHEYETQMLEQQKEHEKQQALAAAELKRQKIIGYSFIGGFGLVLILAFVIYRSFRQKKKANALLEEKNTIIEEKNKDITDSIRYAQNIQSAILPHEAEIKKALPDHFIYFKPRDIVSGDFYWFAKQNGKIHIAACDCTGHGVPGAFVSMIGNDLLNQIIIERGIEDSGEILTQLNNGVKSVFT